VAEIARARGSTLAEAAFEYGAERAAFLGGQFGASQWTCPDWGELVSDRGPLGNHPAATSKATPKAASASLPKWPSGSARATSAPRPTELTPGAEPSP
jgi:hypothetical protein